MSRWNQATAVNRENLLRGEAQFYFAQPRATPACEQGRWAYIQYEHGAYVVVLYEGQRQVTHYTTRNLAAARDTGRNWAQVKGEGRPPAHCSYCGSTFNVALDNEDHLACQDCYFA